MNILITAGPTREALDPVRYITNRSSGKMGYALAEAARDAGHEVTLISGPVNLSAPEGITLIHVESAKEMFLAVESQISKAAVAIFAAAVADYRPATQATQKIKKSSTILTLTLEKTEDILGSARQVFGFSGILVGFAAETENLIANAHDKLTRKGCDLVIANDVSQIDIGFESPENAVTLCFPGEKSIPLPQQSKTLLSRDLIQQIEQLVTKPRQKHVSA
jgi:phosphopantothenoylcysteine synthetase/decarboxylase